MVVAYGFGQFSSLSMLRNARRHEILSGGKDGLSAPYGDHWGRWCKVCSFMAIETLVRFISSAGVASTHRNEREGRNLLSQATDT